MYKKKKNLRKVKFCFFGRSHTHVCLGRTDETKMTTRVIACYCWKEDGHLFQSLLFVDVFVVAVVVFFNVLVCAVSMDSSKVGKCRIACCSCLFTGKKTKHTHYNFHS